MITERTLKAYRRIALDQKESTKGFDSTSEFTATRRIMADIILKLTQELLDQHLLRRK